MKSSALDKSASWWGTALYLNFDPTSNFGLTLRGEYFPDKDGVKINPVDPAEAPGLNVFDLTLSGLYKVAHNPTIISGIRLDNGSKNFFYKTDANTYSKNTFSAMMAAVYHF